MMHTPVFACPPRGTRVRARVEGRVHDLVALEQRGEWSFLALLRAEVVPVKATAEALPYELVVAAVVVDAADVVEVADAREGRR